MTERVTETSVATDVPCLDIDRSVEASRVHFDFVADESDIYAHLHR